MRTVGEGRDPAAFFMPTGYTQDMRDRASRLALLLALALCLPGMATRRANQPSLIGVTIFPPDNPWNWDISGHNVHPKTLYFVNSVGSATSLRADFSFEINTVAGGTPKTIEFAGGYNDETDLGPNPGPLGGGTPFPYANTTGQYRFPASPRVEGGGDAHCLCVDTTNNILYETYQMDLSTTPWSATCGAIFNLATNDYRPDGWTSGDAAGLPILPGLLRADEVAAGTINHALRVTVPNSQASHYFPARHHAASGTKTANDPPMGLRFRLKSSFDTSGLDPYPKVVADALKLHGLIVADNSSTGPWYISTTVDDDWTGRNMNSTSVGLGKIKGSDMEAIETVDGAGNPILPGAIPPPSPVIPLSGGGGGGGGGGCGATGLEASLLLIALAAVLRVSRSGAR